MSSNQQFTVRQNSVSQTILNQLNKSVSHTTVHCLSNKISLTVTQQFTASQTWFHSHSQSHNSQPVKQDFTHGHTTIHCQSNKISLTLTVTQQFTAGQTRFLSQSHNNSQLVKRDITWWNNSLWTCLTLCGSFYVPYTYMIFCSLVQSFHSVKQWLTSLTFPMRQSYLSQSVKQNFTQSNHSYLVTQTRFLVNQNSQTRFESTKQFRSPTKTSINSQSVSK